MDRTLAASARIIGSTPRSTAGPATAHRNRSTWPTRHPFGVEQTRRDVDTMPASRVEIGWKGALERTRDRVYAREERKLFGNSGSHGLRYRPILIRSAVGISHAPRRKTGSGCNGCDPSSTSKNGRKVGDGKSSGCLFEVGSRGDHVLPSFFLSKLRAVVRPRTPLSLQ